MSKGCGGSVKKTTKTKSQIDVGAVQEGNSNLGGLDLEGAKDVGYWIDGFLFKLYSYVEDMLVKESVFPF